MRQFPTGSRYVDVLQNTSLCFTDQDLRGARPKLDKLGRPRPISGNFASVFDLTSASGARYAVKCFTREVCDQEHRYQAISDHLATINHPWKVGFEYLSHGVMVSGEWFPVLKMEWVSGVGLHRWIEDHLSDALSIGALAERFAELSHQLSAVGIAHGDLQHGNLIVAPDGSLRLVDYDGMYVPALAGSAAAEKGHRNYQSPRRADTDFGPELDRFSVWVIYLSLVALAADPVLWHQLHEPGGEYLLLDSRDFENPDNSLRMPALLRHHSDQVRELAERVRDQLSAPLAQLPELIPVAATAGTAPPPASTPTPPPRTSTGPLPPWMAGYVASPPPAPPVSFARPRPFFRTVWCILALIFAVLPARFGAPGVAAAVVLVAFGAGGLTLLYRRRSEVASKREAQKLRNETVKRFAGPRQELARLQRARDGFEKKTADRTASFSSRQQALQKRQQDELARIDRQTQRRLTHIARRIGDISSKRDREFGNELRQVQDEHVRIQLSRARIAPGQVPGIGAVAVGRLRAAGIATAADFTGVRLVAGSGRYGNVVAYLRLARGREIRVDGIGEAKATSLQAWRQSHEQSARRTQPTSLPADRRKAIADRFAAEERALTAEQATARAEADAQRKAIAARIAADRTALLDERRRADIETATWRAESNQKIAALRAHASAGIAQIEAAERDVARYRHVTFIRFVGFALSSKPS